jgi:purine nucleosidase
VPEPRDLVFLDCDTGIDDALAIAFLARSETVRLVGVGTVSGNTDAATAARNTLALLDLLGLDDVPVAVGERDFTTHPYSGGAPHVHGDNGIGGVVLPTSPRQPVEQDAAHLLVSLARRHPGRLRVLAIGPLTNLARALELEPALPELVQDVTVMGGAFLVRGNVTPLAEANIHNDPEAADAVFAADWPVTLLPLDVTTGHRFLQEHLDALLPAPEPFAAIGRMLDTYFDFYATVYGTRVAILHDPLAAAVLTGTSDVTNTLDVPVLVTTDDGPERGRTRADLRTDGSATRRHVRVVLTVRELFAPVLLERLVGTVRSA